MKPRSIFKMLMVLALTVCAVFMIASCGHEHDYKPTVTPSTCTTDGYTTYTCECGESYTGDIVPAGHKMTTVAAANPTCTTVGYNEHSACTGCDYKEGYVEVPALGHTNKYEIVKYPTATEAGERKCTCTVCNTVTTEAIDALTFHVPQFTSAIKSMIGNAKYTLKSSDGAYLLYTTECDTSVVDSVRNYIVIELAEAVLDGKSEALNGYIKLSLGRVRVEYTGTAPTKEELAQREIEEKASVYIYFNGNEFSAEIVEIMSEAEKHNLMEYISEAFEEMFGIPYENFATLINKGNELLDYAPFFEGLVDFIENKMPNMTAEYLEKVNQIAGVFGESFITETTEGANTVYSLNIGALKGFLALAENKTVSALIDEIYGAGMGKTMQDFFKALPEKKVNDIVNIAMEIADNYNVNVNDIYYIIDLMAYLTVEADGFNFASIIEENGSKKLSEALADYLVEGDDLARQEFITEFNTAMNDISEGIGEVTLNDLYAMAMGINEEVDLVEDLTAVIDNLADDLILSATFDAEGNLVDFVFDLGDNTYGAVVDNNNGTISVTVKLDDMSAEVEISDTGFNFVVKSGATDIAVLSLLTVVEDNVVSYAVDFTLFGEDYLDFIVAIDSVNSEFGVNLVVRADEYDYSTGESVYVGIIDIFDLTVYGEFFENGSINLMYQFAQYEEYYIEGEAGIRLGNFNIGEGDTIYNTVVFFTKVEESEDISEYYLAVGEEAGEIFFGSFYNEEEEVSVTLNVPTATSDKLAADVVLFGNDYLDFAVEPDSVNGIIDITFVLRNAIYKYDSEQGYVFDRFGDIFNLSAALTPTENGADVEFTVVDKNGNTCEGSATVAVENVAGEDGNTLTFSVTGEYSGENEAEFSYIVTAYEDATEKSVNSSLAITVEGNEITYSSQYVIKDNEVQTSERLVFNEDVKYDVSVGRKYESTETTEKYLFDIDIKDYLIESYLGSYNSVEGDILFPIDELISGALDLELVIEH